MERYINADKIKYDRIIKGNSEFSENIRQVLRNTINQEPTVNVVEKEMILDFIGDNRPTEIQTDFEKGCAYMCDEIEKLLK